VGRRSRNFLAEYVAPTLPNESRPPRLVTLNDVRRIRPFIYQSASGSNCSSAREDVRRLLVFAGTVVQSAPRRKKGGGGLHTSEPSGEHPRSDSLRRGCRAR